MTHFYRWKKHRPDLLGRECRVLARGRMNSCLVEFAGGELHVVSRFAIRRSAGPAPLREDPPAEASRRGTEAQR